MKIIENMNEIETLNRKTTNFFNKSTALISRILHEASVKLVQLFRF